jgi:hypothetical protein
MSYELNGTSSICVNITSTPESWSSQLGERQKTVQGETLIGALEHTPFSAVHPQVAGRRNSIHAIDDEETITLGPAQEIGARQHASSRTLLRAKRK